MNNPKGNTPILLLAAVFTACTIDARDDEGGSFNGSPPGDNGGGNGTTPRTDGGDPTPPRDGGTGNGGDDDADVYQIEYVAPPGATHVMLEGNFEGGVWATLVEAQGRTVRWEGRLHYRRLDRPACVGGARHPNEDCGYVWNVQFNTDPNFACVLDGTGTFRVVGTPSVQGAFSVENARVENGARGCNLHLRFPREATPASQ